MKEGERSLRQTKKKSMNQRISIIDFEKLQFSDRKIIGE